MKLQINNLPIPHLEYYISLLCLPTTPQLLYTHYHSNTSLYFPYYTANYTPTTLPTTPLLHRLLHPYYTPTRPPTILPTTPPTTPLIHLLLHCLLYPYYTPITPLPHPATTPTITFVKRGRVDILHPIWVPFTFALLHLLFDTFGCLRGTMGRGVVWIN